MTDPIQYDADKGPIQIDSVLSVPHVITVRSVPRNPAGARGTDGRLPHIIYTTGLGADTRAITAQGPSYDDPLAFRFDAGSTLALPYLGSLYVSGGRGVSTITVYSRTSQERYSPAWPLPPQPWTLSQASNGTEVQFNVPMGSAWLRITGSGGTLVLTYGGAPSETYQLDNQDRLSLSGVTSVSFTPNPARPAQAIINGWL